MSQRMTWAGSPFWRMLASDTSPKPSLGQLHLYSPQSPANISKLNAAMAMYSTGVPLPVDPQPPLFQRLTSYEWIGCSRVMDDQQVLRIARIFSALKTGLNTLKAYYEALTEPPAPRSLFPYITQFKLDATRGAAAAPTIVDFQYFGSLEGDVTCITFLAIRLDTNTPIVVKFVRGYGAEAHRLLAEKGFAPKLVAYHKLDACDDMSVVVMEYLDGMTLFEKYGPIEKLPEVVRIGVRTALDLLRERGFIFPDLRRPNVMVVGPADRPECVRFIDFDWVCRGGEGVRYPLHLGREIKNTAQVEEYEVITSDHEDRMFNVMFPQ